MLLIGLMLIHNIRRLLECVFVSVYSPSGTINVAHYLIGIALYTSFSFVVIVESPDPVTSGKSHIIQYYLRLSINRSDFF